MDLKNGRVVKFVHFEDDGRDAGDPVELARYYSEQGADEVVFLDITATNEGRGTVVELIRRAAEELTVPFAVGGGIRSVDDFRTILGAGASKVSVNTSAVLDKALVSAAAREFGSERVVVAIDTSRNEDGIYEVLINGGMKGTGLDAVAWAREVEALGAGEILLTSKDADGTKNGYDLVLTRAVSDAVRIPVVASGGCGTLEDLRLALTEGGADGALAASLFHFRELTVREVKDYLKAHGVAVK